MKTILYDLLHNLTLLMSGFYLLGKLSPHPITVDSKRSVRILYGISLSLLSWMLMQLTIEPVPGVLVDLRHIPVIVAAYFAGPLPTAIVTIVIILYRFSISLNSSAYAAALFITLIAVGTSLLVKWLPIYSKRTFTLVTVYATVLHGIVLIYVLADSKLIMDILSVVLPASFISSWLALVITRDIRLTKQSMRTWQQTAQRDFLTGLHNFRAFTDHFDDLKQQTILQQHEVALITVDIDHFKHVNDTFGHEAGDEVLRQFASRLRDGVTDAGFISRNGGEEFSVLVEQLTDVKVLALAEQLRERIATSPFQLSNGTQLPLTASFGVAHFPKSTSQIQQLVTDADVALYHSKQNGRNRVTLFTRELEVAVTHPVD
ncbi:MULTISPECIES: diguanylate cyclase [unclassified Exiguobacterium]|uniref:GGDEF domain-containing protein n=1 Tax=unclassified Exiguobacterium TaxID=2644629 RepID=UPI001BECAA77|nr:diguanylate cyclase [Exiguobacterium sp. s138]